MSERRIDPNKISNNIFGNDLYTIKNYNHHPHNISLLGENFQILEIATPGFHKEELEITLNDDVLGIKGHKSSVKNSLEANHHQGISREDFHLKFRKPLNYKIENVTYNNGVLRIILKKSEHSNTIKIDIN